MAGRKGKCSTGLGSVLNIMIIITLFLLLTLTFIYIYKMSVAKRETFVEAKRTVVYVYSTTCPHCISFTPIWDQYVASTSATATFKFVKVEKSDAQEFMKYIDGYPTVIILDDDKRLIKKSVGKITYTELRKFVESEDN